MNQIVKSGSRAVTIYSQQPRRFEARLYVNCTDRNLGDATLVSRKFISLEMARAWAARTLGAALVSP